MKPMFKAASLSGFILLATIPFTNAQLQAFPVFERDYATEYCEYYRTRAAFAKQRERNGIRSKYRNKTAHSLRSQYITCLKKYATQRTYIPAR